MSWLYLKSLCSQGVAADCSDHDCSDGEPSALSNTTPTGRRASSRGKRTACSILSQFGMTRELSTDGRGVERLISSLPDSHASHSATPANNAARPMIEMDGPTPLESLAKYDPESHGWKTSVLSFHYPTGAPYSGTWPRSGMTRDGVLYRLPMPVRRTDGNDCGVWPTPQNHDAMPGYSHRVKRFGTKHGGRNLNDEAVSATWPTTQDAENLGGPSQFDRNTPPLNAAVWLTPAGMTGVDATGKKGAGWEFAKQVGQAVQSNRNTNGKPRGSLNPDWVESLMGWPMGWTRLGSGASGSLPLAMDRFLRAWFLRGDCSARELSMNESNCTDAREAVSA